MEMVGTVTVTKWLKKNGVKSKPRWKSGYCQICKIPDLFHDFE